MSHLGKAGKASQKEEEQSVTFFKHPQADASDPGDASSIAANASMPGSVPGTRVVVAAPGKKAPGSSVATAQAIQRLAAAGVAKAANSKKTKNRKRSQKARWTKDEVSVSFQFCFTRGEVFGGVSHIGPSASH